MKNTLSGIVLFLCLVSTTLQAQVSVTINSGNPAFPFPQFLPYSHPDGTQLGNLADHNPYGVPHAELEQRVRDGWQIMANNIQQVAGAKAGGIQYLRSNADLDCHCAEAYGYYLLAAAYMADKNVYDGLYMYYHDNSFNGVTRFIDGVQNTYGGYSRGLSYAGSFGAGAAADPKGGGISGNSATDGDHDIALATLVAYKQWGEHSGITVNGKEINYKDEALNYIKALVDTSLFALSLPNRVYNSGDVGLDGYIKNGDSWNELTNFAQTGYKGIKPARTGGDVTYFDYYAPSYYREFGDWLVSMNVDPWGVSQFRRGETSSDWVMGQLYNQGAQKIPFAANLKLSAANVPTFTNFSDGEDFRSPWRTILNYVWHGNPKDSWDPVAHEVTTGVPNTFERDMGIRAASFVKSPQTAPWTNACKSFGTVPLTFRGPGTLGYQYDVNGNVLAQFTLNWPQGTFSPAAVAAQDFDLMGEMFRQCVIEWDANDTGYISSHPKYFHEWFRMLGMMVLTGNHQSPSAMVPIANLKVYHAIDKTVAFNNDLVTFTIDYRNYGSLAATGSKISFPVPADFTYVSSSKTPSSTGGTISWDLGTVPGYSSANPNAAKGSFTVTFRLSSTSSGRYSISPLISCVNGSGWTSNEFPNRITSVMERNSVDVIKRALKISKTANYPIFNPGDTLSYTIAFTNSSDAGWINGGRPGVNFAFAHDVMTAPDNAPENTLKFRIFNDAQEAYIDYGNYRFSYYISEPSMKCIVGDSGCTTGWGIMKTIYEGGDPTGVKFMRENIVPGSDSNGAWNQRVAIKFAPQLATTSQHLLNYSGLKNRIKQGGTALLRGVWRLSTSNYSNINWQDDWSWDANAGDADGGIYYPVSPDVTDPLKAPVPVNKWHRSSCETATKTVSKILVEEWDGYVWRRIFGNGPLPGRDIQNVVVTDTLPAGVTFAGFTGPNPLGIAAKYDSVKHIVTWTIPQLLINQKGSITYQARVLFPSKKDCPTANELIISKAWISGNAESPLSSIDTVTVSCNKVTICNSSPTFVITTDKASYTPQDSAVVYTINYTQTEGTIGSSALNSTSDWKIQSGSGVTVSNGSLNAVSNSTFLITQNYSHGTNTLGDGIQGRFKAETYSRIGVALRYDPATKTGVYLGFKVDALDTKIYVYNNGQLLISGSIPIVQPQFDFQIQLTGPKLDLWIGTAPFDGPPLFSTTGILVQPGYAGIIDGPAIGGENSGTHQLVFWKAHLDSGFDVVLSNPLAAGIGSASSITNNGSLAAGNVSWALSTSGVPVLAGTKFTVSWKGKIKDCKSGLDDKAYINMFGEPRNFVQSCVLASCSSTVVHTPVTLTLTGQNTQISTVLLSWSTTSVESTAYFEVLRSIGGNTWVEIAQVNVSGTNLSYTYEDTSPLTGVSYYQVTQVFDDSTSVSSSIVTIGRSTDLYFNVETKDNFPWLIWTSSEQLTDHYELLRSTDGVNWVVIDTTLPLGTGTIYTMVDQNAIDGTDYYEVKQVLTNGVVYTSPILTYQFVTAVDGAELSELKIYPNPIASQIFINWQSSKAFYDIDIYSALGVLVYHQNALATNEIQQIQPGKELSPGSYILKLTSDDRILHRQLIKR